MKTLFLTLLFAALTLGCDDANGTTSTETAKDAPAPIGGDDTARAPETPPADEPKAEPAATGTAAPGATMPKAGEEVAVIETNHGRIVLKFFPDVAPGHVENFKKLAKKGFYNGTKFHRVIPGFMIQGGDPNSKDDDRSDDGTGGPGYEIKAEFNSKPHTKGILSMARSQDPDSAGSQFFITVDNAPSLDGQYTVFGQVVQGMDVADKIVALERDERDNPLPKNPAVMKTVKIEKWPVK
ncbi:MAG TPA: peptidylprolyl isomerase [Fimbriimonas sp.]